MITEHIEDTTWPICVEIRDFSNRWYAGSGKIEIDVSFVLEPRCVPIEIQSIGLCYSGNWFYGIDFAEMDEIPQLVGRELDIKALTRPYMAYFKIPEPTDRDTVIINPALVVDALDLPCTADLDTIELTKQE